MTIRDADPTDAATLRDLHRRSSYVWEEDRAQLDAHPDVFGVAPGALDARWTRVAVADGGGPTGFATVIPRDDGEYILEDLFVEPELMRGGIGRALVEDAAARAIAAGATSLSVVAAARTQPFYERLGFVLQREAPTRFGPALRLVRTLP